MKNVIESIEQFLSMAKERNLDASGNPNNLCFTVNGLKLDQCFNVPQTRVMFIIHPQNKDALILIPEEVAIRSDAKLSCDFISSSRFPVGWKCVFENTFLNIGNVFELVFSVAGLLANLSLYNLIRKQDVTKKADVTPVEVLRILENLSNDSSSNNSEQINKNDNETGTSSKNFKSTGFRIRQYSDVNDVTENHVPSTGEKERGK
ncbi:MAG: hypothetical protein A2Y10_14770 [Planctomycetes bacterium GWF2_41_51]|nr:MAG: hypothetical protein A2Y10_14770 [Planctomycetes bacterium GWF2_41_51]HBG28994.1 hypothetical protein [Phycisphaerales bacterium]